MRAAGETGEVVVQGPHVMSGYWGRPAETAAALDGGWFRSGDAVRWFSVGRGGR
ncbi:AMP-binding protein [Actinomadura sp. GC306]|uniref:AMP-binding protein n=1 Tax=Actinomadura sp. GC306 TaxID=2530367 RepID=UPI001A9DC10D